MKKLRAVFIKKNLKITKLFMNFMIWAYLIEDVVKDSGCFMTDEEDPNKDDVTQHQRASIIAYCETSKSYPQVLDYMKGKYNDSTINNIFEYDNELEFSDPEDL